MYFKNSRLIKKLTSVIILPGVTSVPDRAFCNSALEEVRLAASVHVIEKNAFSGCRSLQIVTFEKLSQLKYIGEEAFWGCVSLKEITIAAATQVGWKGIHRSVCITRE